MKVVLMLPDSATDEMRHEQMRFHRDELLKQSDWTQTNDAPVNQQAWATYRQKLRDFPSTWEPSETVEFPDPPA